MARFVVPWLVLKARPFLTVQPLPLASVACPAARATATSGEVLTATSGLMSTFAPSIKYDHPSDWSDRIHLIGARFYGFHGALPEVGPFRMHAMHTT